MYTVAKQANGSETMRIQNVYKLFLLIALLFCTNSALADQCPDLSNALPSSDWAVWPNSSSQPSGHDAYKQAIITEDFMPNIGCSYTNPAGSFIIYKGGYYAPQSGPWHYCSPSIDFTQCCTGDINACQFSAASTKKIK
jgi:hypothetical protein